jgi:putative hemolysin
LDTYLSLGLLALLALLMCSALFSGSETALISMSRHRLKNLREKFPSKAGAINDWLDDPNRMLTTLLIGINAANMLAAIVMENIIDSVVARHHWPGWAAPAISFGIVSVIVIEFCEILPKILAYNNAERAAMAAIGPMSLANRAISPIGRGFVWVAGNIVRLFGGKIDPTHRAFVTEAEIIGLVDSGEEQGVIDKEEREMIRSIFEFGDTQAREVMTPRPDMQCASADATVAEMAQFIEQAGHSRIPIFENSEDNIIGIINSRALITALKEGRDNEPVRNFMHPAYFVPETKMIDDLLRAFQTRRMHIAIVIDEYGATAGLVTLEDLLEEIVGEIRDEYDTEEPLFRWIASDTLRADARINVAELNDVLGSNFTEEEDFSTLGGLIFNELGKVPKTGEKLTVDAYEMTVEKMVGRRIGAALIRKPPASVENSEDESQD